MAGGLEGRGERAGKLGMVQEPWDGRVGTRRLRPPAGYTTLVPEHWVAWCPQASSLGPPNRKSPRREQVGRSKDGCAEIPDTVPFGSTGGPVPSVLWAGDLAGDFPSLGLIHPFDHYRVCPVSGSVLGYSARQQQSHPSPQGPGSHTPEIHGLHGGPKSPTLLSPTVRQGASCLLARAARSAI